MNKPPYPTPWKPKRYGHRTYVVDAGGLLVCECMGPHDVAWKLAEWIATQANGDTPCDTR